MIDEHEKSLRKVMMLSGFFGRAEQDPDGVLLIPNSILLEAKNVIEESGDTLLAMQKHAKEVEEAANEVVRSARDVISYYEDYIFKDAMESIKAAWIEGTKESSTPNWFKSKAKEAYDELRRFSQDVKKARASVK